MEYALRSGAQIVASSYNEPLITSEWAMDIFELAKKEGLRTVYVSNGYATPEVLKALKPHLDLATCRHLTAHARASNPRWR